MAKAGRNNLRYQESKSAVIGAAIAILNRQGVTRMTLAAVAARLGLSAPTIQYYFNKKEDLASACLIQGLNRLGEFLSNAETKNTKKDRLEIFFKEYFEFRERAVRGEVEEFPSFSDARGLNTGAVFEEYIVIFRRLRTLISETDTAPMQKICTNSEAHLILSELHWSPVWFRRVFPGDSARFGGRMFEILSKGIAAPGKNWAPISIAVAIPKADTSDGASFEIFLRAASAQINEQGYRGTSVDKITGRLNLTKGAFYHHIKTKDEIVLSCFRRTFEVMHKTIKGAEEISNNGLQTLSTIVVALVEHQIYGEAPLLRASAVNNTSEAHQVEIFTGIDTVVTRIASVISDGILDGSVRPLDANVAANMIMAIINGADELPYFARGITPAEVSDYFVRPIFNGLLSQ